MYNHKHIFFHSKAEGNLKHDNPPYRVFCLFVIAFLLFSSSEIFAQGVGINPTGNPPDPSAGLDVNFTNKGTLITRMTTLQRDAINSPAEGLQIFNTTTKCLEIFANSAWQSIFCSCISPSAPVAGTNTASQTQINWNWNTVSGATGYKYNTSNNYSTATDNGASTSYIQVGLTCNITYTLYVWAYNGACVSTVTTLTQNSSSCFITATGGAVTTDGEYMVHTFTSNGTFQVTNSASGNVWYLVVAGGGGGGGGIGGGGGAGGYRTNGIYSYTGSTGSYPVTVGSGGGGGNNTTEGGNGGNSAFDTITAVGGGGGGYGQACASVGKNGGSGGGGGGAFCVVHAGGTGIAGQGNAGGTSQTPDGSTSGGGGGAELLVAMIHQPLQATAERV